jgi:hypothetical protein
MGIVTRSALAIMAGCMAGALPLRGAAAMPARVLCMGYVQPSPEEVHIGGVLSVRGHGFSCKAPTGRLFPSATVIIYQPRYGFAIFTAKVTPKGTYLLLVHIPKMLIAASSISGGSQKNVLTQPGTYYIAVRLFDVDLPLPNEALAHLQIVR